MGRKPDYETLYKITLYLLRKNGIDVTVFDSSELHLKTGCSKPSLYNHMHRIEQDFFDI